MKDNKTPKIRVLVRKRPLNKKQQSKGETDIVTIQNSQTVIVRQQKYKVDLTPYIDEYKFNFDGAFDQHTTNQQIYLTQIRPLLDCAFDGARVLCFAYGQTGSGKTFTMLGDGNSVQGLYLLAAYDIFKQLSQLNRLSVWVSFYEIYCGKLHDLLNDRNVLFAREDAKNNVNIVGLSQRKIINVQNLMQIIQFGTSVRVTAQNGTNVDSSRSHAILQISLKNDNKLNGKISFIDLAGSQRAADHADQLEKQTRIDGAQINKSLLALKQCIRALDQNKHHTPFRGSKLTMVLKDSFTGYCRTVMIGNISPNSASCENTLNTLKYADRVKQLKRPNKDIQMMQINNLDQLSKELMLPRQMINQKKYANEVYKQGDDQGTYQNNQQRENNHYSSNYNQSNKNNRKQSEEESLFIKNPRLSAPQHSQLAKNYSPIRNSPGGKQRQRPNSQAYSSSLFTNGLFQQEQPPPQTNEHEYFSSLSKRHENYIQLVINEQQQLMSCHENHINTAIQLIKQEMFLMNEADKIGSSIEKYLDDLDSVLQKQLNSIFGVRDQVQKLKRDLKQSLKLQKQYIEQSNKLYGALHEEILLDDDEHLFY